MKAALRQRLRQRRRTLHSRHPEAAGQAAEVFRRAGLLLPPVAASYLAAGSELDPAPLAAWLARQGVRMALPVVTARDAPLAFREDVGGERALDALGLPVPPAHAPELRPDLLLVPLLGFDRQGGRIGQGGGYYDRTLQALRAAGPPVVAVGLAYAGQEVDDIPMQPFDQRLDGVLTETAYLSFP